MKILPTSPRHLLLLIITIKARWTNGQLETSPNLRALRHDYAERLGDVNFGTIFHIHEWNLENLCGKGFSYAPLHTAPHIINYEVQAINKRHDILPNITLGFVALDDCERDIPTVPRMLQLLPLTTDRCSQDDGLTVGRNFKVVGILGTTSSEASAILSTMTGFFQLPQLGVYASSDELSDKARFPYFFRLLPPDRFTAKATVELCKAMDWTYVSVLYVEADFGYNGNAYVQKYAREVGVCIEKSYALSYDSLEKDYEGIIREMATNTKAKIIIVYLFPTRIRRLLTTYKKIKSTLPTELIFILPECFPWGMTRGLLDALAGTMQVSLPTTPMPGFLDVYEAQNPWNTPWDPWLPDLWEYAFDCTFDNSSFTENQPLCEEFRDITVSRKYISDPALQRWGIAVHVLAHALDAFIRDQCPQAFRDKTVLNACIKPWLLKEYIKNVQFEFNNEVIKFNQDQEWLRQYVFRQVRFEPISGRYAGFAVGSYATETSNLTLDMDSMAWDEDLSAPAPESVCAYPCDAGEIIIQGDVICCWECYRCRENEIVNENMTRCTICPETTWPDENSTTCEPIPPSYLSYSHVYGVGMLSLGVLGLVMSAGAIVLVLKHTDRRVIKGASPDMLLVILSGALLACLTVPTFILKPSAIWCYMSRAGFGLSCTLMFAPLLIKTLRVHRVFAASKQLQTEIYCVSRLSVNAQAICVILVQVAVTAVLGVIFPPMVVIRMPIRAEKYAELQCDLELYGIVGPLGYNMFVLLLCSIYGLLTRKLPDNFNESWYIFVTVCTTLFIWIAFIPTYFSAFYAFHKAALLSLALFLNAFMVLLCLFGPKLYALFYVPDKDIKITNFKSPTESSSDAGSGRTGVGSTNLDRDGSLPKTSKVADEC